MQDEEWRVEIRTYFPAPTTNNQMKSMPPVSSLTIPTFTLDIPRFTLIILRFTLITPRLTLIIPDLQHFPCISSPSAGDCPLIITICIICVFVYFTS